MTIDLYALEGLVARSQAIAVEGRGIFDAVQAFSAQLSKTMVPHLPEGTSPSDSFVGAIAEAIAQDLMPMRAEGTDEWPTVSADDDEVDRLLLLEDIWFAAKHQVSYARRMHELIATVASSIDDFVHSAGRPRRRMEAGGNLEPDEAHPLTSESHQARSLANQALDLFRFADEVATDALVGLTQLRWGQAAQEIGDEALTTLWTGIARGEVRVADVIENKILPPAQTAAFQAFIEDMSSHLTQEIVAVKHLSAPTADATPRSLDDDIAIIPPKFCVKIAYPDPVRVGDVFDVVVTARNDHLVPVVLDTIDIENAFLNGFDIEQVSPAPVERRLEQDEVTFAFEQHVEPAGAAVVTFTLRARSEGNFTGEVRVWTDEIEDAFAVPNIDVVGTVQ